MKAWAVNSPPPHHRHYRCCHGPDSRHGNLADLRCSAPVRRRLRGNDYGVALANLFLLPVANKLKSVCGLVLQQSRYREIADLRVWLSIAEGENPRSIEMKLEGFPATDRAAYAAAAFTKSLKITERWLVLIRGTSSPCCCVFCGHVLPSSSGQRWLIQGAVGNPGRRISIKTAAVLWILFRSVRKIPAVWPAVDGEGMPVIPAKAANPRCAAGTSQKRCSRPYGEIDFSGRSGSAVGNELWIAASESSIPVCCFPAARRLPLDAGVRI